MGNRVKSLKSSLIVGAVLITIIAIMAPTNAFAATVTIGGPTAADWVDSGTTAGIVVALEAIPANEASRPYATYPAADAIFDAPDRDTIGGRTDGPFGLGVDNTLISNGMPGVTSKPSEIGYYGNPAICGDTTVLGANCADELRVTLDKALHGGSFQVTFFYGSEESGETLRVALYLDGDLQDSDVYGPAPTGSYSQTNPGRWTFDLPDLSWDEIRFIGDDAAVADATDFLVEYIRGEEVTLEVVKFYDANVNGINDDVMPITGWKVNIDGPSYDPAQAFLTPFGPTVVDPGEYTVTEAAPNESNWVRTTPNPVVEDVGGEDDGYVEFGNVCIGAGGGKTLGYWSNNNGFNVMNDGVTMEPELLMLRDLNLVGATGAAFDPLTYAGFRTWLLGANATNMSYMLSAQLAAMELNVEAGLVNGSSLVYAPGVPGANPLGFISVSDLMDEANTELGTDGYTPAGDPERANQEMKKNALDKANNNKNFVQPTACAFSFPP